MYRIIFSLLPNPPLPWCVLWVGSENRSSKVQDPTSYPLGPTSGPNAYCSSKARRPN
jgi:hypothetical protein